MKTKQFLIRTSDGGVVLATGLLLQDHPELACVSSNEMNLKYSIIDIASGLFILVDATKKKLLFRWETNKETLVKRIEEARLLPRYEQRCSQLKSYVKAYRDRGVEVSYL